MRRSQLQLLCRCTKTLPTQSHTVISHHICEWFHVCVCVIDGAKARVTAQYWWCVGVKPWGCFWEERPFLVKNLYVSFWLLDRTFFMCVTQIIVFPLCSHSSTQMTLSCPLIFAATSFDVLTSSSLLTRSMSKGNTSQHCDSFLIVIVSTQRKVSQNQCSRFPVQTQEEIFLYIYWNNNTCLKWLP